jgi:hypothetical protein
VTAIRARAEVAFPQAGGDVGLRFTVADCAALQERYGPEWFTRAPLRLQALDAAFIRDCLSFGMKRDGKPYATTFDKIEGALAEHAPAILEALSLAVLGQAFVDAANRPEPGVDERPPTPES